MGHSTPSCPQMQLPAPPIPSTEGSLRADGVPGWTALTLQPGPRRSRYLCGRHDHKHPLTWCLFLSLTTGSQQHPTSIISEQTVGILSHYLLSLGFAYFSELHFGGTYYKAVTVNCAFCKNIVFCLFLGFFKN